MKIRSPACLIAALTLTFTFTLMLTLTLSLRAHAAPSAVPASSAVPDPSAPSAVPAAAPAPSADRAPTSATESELVKSLRQLVKVLTFNGECLVIRPEGCPVLNKFQIDDYALKTARAYSLMQIRTQFLLDVIEADAEGTGSYADLHAQLVHHLEAYNAQPLVARIKGLANASTPEAGRLGLAHLALEIKRCVDEFILLFGHIGDDLDFQEEITL